MCLISIFLVAVCQQQRSIQRYNRQRKEEEQAFPIFLSFLSSKPRSRETKRQREIGGQINAKLWNGFGLLY